MAATLPCGRRTQRLFPSSVISTAGTIPGISSIPDGTNLEYGKVYFADIKKGEAYKYAIHSNNGEYLEKADPFAFYAETAPKTASIVWEEDMNGKMQHGLVKERS